MRSRDDRAVPSARRPARLLSHVLFDEGTSRRLKFDAVAWDDDAVRYLDQRLLPRETKYVRAQHRRRVRRGDSLVGGARRALHWRLWCVCRRVAALAQLRRRRGPAAQQVREARPTAVNLAWAVDHVLASPDYLTEARAIHAEQIATDDAIGEYGLELIRKGAGVLTHCNTGPLATAGGGTALGVILAAHRAGKKPRVYVDETRPLLQGARLNYLELRNAGVEAVLMVDSAAALAMSRRQIDAVIVGADRIARNGDTANKMVLIHSPCSPPITRFRSTWPRRARHLIST